jgi:hypothetical protein
LDLQLIILGKLSLHGPKKTSMRLSSQLLICPSIFLFLMHYFTCKISTLSNHSEEIPGSRVIFKVKVKEMDLNLVRRFFKKYFLFKNKLK